MEKENKMKTTTMMKKLQQAFPKLDLRTTEDFYGEPQRTLGIWLRGAWNYDLELHDTLNSETSNNALLRAIEKQGWYVEPYDSETFMAYPN